MPPLFGPDQCNRKQYVFYRTQISFIGIKKKKVERPIKQSESSVRTYMHMCVYVMCHLWLSLWFELSKSEVIKPSKAKSSKTERTKPSHTFSILIAVINCIAVDCPRFKFKLYLSAQFSRRFEKLNASQIIFSALFVYTQHNLCKWKNLKRNEFDGLFMDHILLILIIKPTANI